MLNSVQNGSARSTLELCYDFTDRMAWCDQSNKTCMRIDRPAKVGNKALSNQYALWTLRSVC
jgi:hypothetical protein